MLRRLATFIASLALLLVVGCGAQQGAPQQASDSGSSKSFEAVAKSSRPPEGSTAATPAAVPRLIAELTSETLVYECPVCKMTFADPGMCTMKCAELVRTQVAYVCAADGKPVEHAGDCPRCDIDAQVILTAMTSEPPAALKGQ